MGLGKIARFTSATAVMAALVFSFFFVLRERRRPTPLSPRLFFLVENPLTGAFVGAPLLVGRLGLTPGMKVLDAGCGPGRLTVPLAKAVGPGGGVVALDCQPAMLGLLEGRLRAEGVKNVRPLLGGLGEGALLGEGAPVAEEGGFDRAVLAMVLGEARDRAGALRELRGALRPGGVLSVTEIFGDPHRLSVRTVVKQAEAAGFRLVGCFGSFPAYTLNFVKEPRSALAISL
jgi:ubiquinone/menaquinone biosynthesis C-methylase UbiE